MSEKQSFHRMPLGFGPFPGPRQTALGKKLKGWDQVKSTTHTIIFQAPTDQLQSLLPADCFSIASGDREDELATASVSYTELENLPWLAGRGYNLCGLYIHNVVCRGQDEVVRGKYLSVMFEDRADPIISGREELGYAKLFASLEKGEGDGFVRLRISWDGTVFCEMNINNLSHDEHSNEALSSHFRPQNVLHYKYIPRTGAPGKADIEYPTVTPSVSAGAGQQKEKTCSLDATLSFTAHGFEALPTLHHIAERLSNIKPIEVKGAGKVTMIGADDIGGQRPIHLG